MNQNPLKLQQKEKILADSKKLLTEGFNNNDLKGIVDSRVGIDEYAATMGDDEDVITLTFKVEGFSAARDLVDWFERGYRWVLDAQASEGAVDDTNGFLVFVELERRIRAISQIIELLEDLETLTDIKLGEWEIHINGGKVQADSRTLKQVIALSPKQYREQTAGSEVAESMEKYATIAHVPSGKPKITKMKSYEPFGNPTKPTPDLDSETMRMVELYRTLM